MTLEYAASLVRRGQIHCSENHEGLPCSRQLSGFVPTRLVSIDPETGPLRLVESIAVTGAYATLSYCWGGVKPLSTTKTTLAARLQHIPECSLPAVFLQAIQLARILGIPYIWIDSLCIIQDSVEDWETESERMSLYFENGCLNIAAATSDNPDKPFTEHIDDKWCPVSVKVHDLQGRPSLINARRVPRLSNSDGDLGILFTRAWAFQESLFARCTINFTTQGVIWSCRDLDTLSDNYLAPSSMVTLRPGSNLPDVPMTGAAPGEDSDEGSEESWLDVWRRLIYYYSHRLLTFPMDRLPAISGAAAKFHEHLHCPYLAGHWYDDLPHSLIWSASNPFGMESLPLEYLAPSWSWASVNQIILCPSWRTDITPAVKLLDADCNVPGKNPYGKVSSGLIDLRGKVVPIVIGMLDGDFYASTPDWDFEPDCALRKTGDSLSRAIVGEAVADFQASASCLYLASLTESGDRYKSKARPPTIHYALVLGWTAREQTSFIRVGLMESTSARAMDLFDGAVEKTVQIV